MKSKTSSTHLSHNPFPWPDIWYINQNKRQEVFTMNSTTMTNSILADPTANQTADGLNNFVLQMGIKGLVNMLARQLYVVST